MIQIQLDQPYSVPFVQETFTTLDLPNEVLPSLLTSPEDTPEISLAPLDSNVALEWKEYEYIHWDQVLTGELIASSYPVRKALIRKARLALMMNYWIAKRPDSILKTNAPEGVAISIFSSDVRGSLYDAFDFIDEQNRLCGFDIEDSDDSDDSDEGEEGDCEGVLVSDGKPLFILKPSMVEKGVAVKVISSKRELMDVIRSERDIAEWVFQAYIPNPLLYRGYKFSLRVYFLVVGAMEVYYYDDIVTFLSAEKYNAAPTNNAYAHITNYYVNKQHGDYDYDYKQLKLSEMYDDIIHPTETQTREEIITSIKQQIMDVGAEIFTAVQNEVNGFLAIPNCFELYGCDFLIDDEYKAMFLEVNAGPDLSHFGERLKPVCETLVKGAAKIVANKYFNTSQDIPEKYHKIMASETRTSPPSMKMN